MKNNQLSFGEVNEKRKGFRRGETAHVDTEVRKCGGFTEQNEKQSYARRRWGILECYELNAG